jgi:hypothetical protein
LTWGFYKVNKRKYCGILKMETSASEEEKIDKEEVQRFELECEFVQLLADPLYLQGTLIVLSPRLLILLIK